MAIITDQQIQSFLAIDIVDGKGDGKGDGNGYGNGYGNGDGYGFGDGNGYGNGDCYSFGDGDGKGYGNGFGDGYGNGDGYGYSFGDGIQEFANYKLYCIDGVPTAITSIHGNVAQGFILEKNMNRKPCFIVKDGNRFAHGNTLRDAFTSLQEKLYDDSTEEERLDAFKTKFPEFDTPYPNRDLFAFHHVLTGSCRMGREQFVSNHGISLDGKTTVREFVRLTRDSYGGSVIRKLPESYGITK